MENARREAAERERIERERIQRDKIRAEQMTRWDRISTRIFGAPLRGGSPCNLPLLKNSRCFDVRLNLPHELSFKVSENPRNQKEQIEIRGLTDEWIMTVHDYAIGPASQRILTRLGFSRAMQQTCETDGPRVFATAALEYRCLAHRSDGARSAPSGEKFLVSSLKGRCPVMFPGSHAIRGLPAFADSRAH